MALPDPCSVAKTTADAKMILDTLEKYEQAAGAQRGQGARNLRSHCGITQIGEDKSTREAPTCNDGSTGAEQDHDACGPTGTPLEVLLSEQ